LPVSVCANQLQYLSHTNTNRQRKVRKKFPFSVFHLIKQGPPVPFKKQKVKSEKETFGKYENVAGSRD
jgi:hypothetical protein